MRCELDAAFFHLYDIGRTDASYIMESLESPNEVILEIYDEMAEATRTGVPFQTRLDPPPAAPASICNV